MFNNELFLLKYGKYMKQLLSIKEKALKIVKSVRGSTAAGINISLLPRNCSCGEFACSAVWEETFPLAFVLNLPMVLYWKRLLSGIRVDLPMVLYGKRLLFSGVCWISGGAVWGRDLFPGICGDLPMVLSWGEAFPLAFFGIRHFLAFGIFGIRHFWHSAHSVPERASCGTEYACRAQKGFLRYATYFQRHSV